MSDNPLKNCFEEIIGDKFENNFFVSDPISSFAFEAGLQVLQDDFLLERGEVAFLKPLGPTKTLVLDNGLGGDKSIGVIYTYSLPRDCSLPPTPLKVLKGTHWEFDLVINCRDQLEALGFNKILIPGVDYTPKKSHASA